MKILDKIFAAVQPSGKTLKLYIIAANDAGQAAQSATVSIVVP
jgi:hypothetical protein